MPTGLTRVAFRNGSPRINRIGSHQIFLSCDIVNDAIQAPTEENWLHGSFTSCNSLAEKTLNLQMLTKMTVKKPNIFSVPAIDSQSLDQ